MRERVRGASRRYFDVFCLDGRRGWGSLFFQHQPVSIANVFFQLLERGALAKDTWYLWQAPDVPVAIFPILESESNSLRHVLESESNSLRHENLVEAAGVELRQAAIKT